jgi:hypothetical protein
MIQDSYCMSHCWRRYIGDTNTLPLLLGMNGISGGINGIDDGKIWTFQDYSEQDGSFHACADEPKQEHGKPTIGYASAENATKEIMRRYKAGLKFDDPGPNYESLRKYLSDEVYAIHPGRGDKDSGECHPLFLKSLGYYSVSDVKSRLYGFSISNEGM